MMLDLCIYDDTTDGAEIRKCEVMLLGDMFNLILPNGLRVALRKEDVLEVIGGDDGK